MKRILLLLLVLFSISLNAQIRKFNAHYGNITLSPAITYDSWNSSDLSQVTLSTSDSTATGAATGGTFMGMVRSHFGKSSGLWYVELKVIGATPSSSIGISPASESNTGQVGAGIGYGKGNGVSGHQHNGINDFVSTECVNGDIMMIAIDLTNGRIWWGRNGSWDAGNPSAGTGAIYTGLSGTFFLAFSNFNATGGCVLNSGTRPFIYTVPTGFNSGWYQ
jgi:hypothetical protein